MGAWQPDDRALQMQWIGSWLCVLPFQVSLPFSDDFPHCTWEYDFGLITLCLFLRIFLYILFNDVLFLKN